MEKMNSLKRNETTAAEAAAIEDGKMNPFFENKEYSKEYLQIHEDRCKKLQFALSDTSFLTSNTPNKLPS
ncbi:hypothetical protein H9Q69_008856 [Fusarium xylarioides]|nr:hypothetical protein H9Q69_008856 [Fusarium xylarioides]KAG5802228.1 hypothetical protein H9Q71_013183 [Fusarium xylarioides]KAG5817155.1 hypothetical protein H9Q74_010688 [Fusarium xylarioides]